MHVHQPELFIISLLKSPINLCFPLIVFPTQPARRTTTPHFSMAAVSSRRPTTADSALASLHDARNVVRRAMGVGPALESTNELLNAIMVGSPSVYDGQPPNNAHRSQRPTGQSTPNWRRAVFVSAKSSAGGQTENKTTLLVFPHSTRSTS